MITIDNEGKLTSDKKYYVAESRVLTEIIGCKCGNWLGLYGIYNAPDCDVDGMIDALWACNSCNEVYDVSKDRLGLFRQRERQFKAFCAT